MKTLQQRLAAARVEVHNNAYLIDKFSINPLYGYHTDPLPESIMINLQLQFEADFNRYVEQKGERINNKAMSNLLSGYLW